MKIHYSKLQDEHKVIAGFTEREDGVSSEPYESLNVKKSELVDDTIENVSANLRKILKEIKTANGVYLHLIGQSEVLSINDQPSGLKTVYGYDGVTTKSNNYILMITVADCFPVMLSSRSGVIAIAHCGWKGISQNILRKITKDMNLMGAKSEEIFVTIGPGICGDCYEVGEEITEAFNPNYIKRTDGKIYLDLKSEILEQLKALGIRNIEDMSECTFENTDKYFSAREEKGTGRFLAFIKRNAA